MVGSSLQPVDCALLQLWSKKETYILVLYVSQKLLYVFPIIMNVWIFNFCRIRNGDTPEFYDTHQQKPWAHHEVTEENHNKLLPKHSHGTLFRTTKKTSWWFQPPLQHISQIGNLPQVGMKIKNVWNHHLEKQLSAIHLQIFVRRVLERVVFLGEKKPASFAAWFFQGTPIFGNTHNMSNYSQWS